MNESIKFAEYILLDYEIIDELDGSFYQLCGTKQKYTAKELYNKFINEKH
jgi:hypothetical protein